MTNWIECVPIVVNILIVGIIFLVGGSYILYMNNKDGVFPLYTEFYLEKKIDVFELQDTCIQIKKACYLIYSLCLTYICCLQYMSTIIIK